MDKIICGGFEWERNPAAEDNRLDDGSIFLANAIAQDELSVDTMEASIFSLCKVPIELDPADYDGMETKDGMTLYCKPDAPDVTDIPYGAPLEYYRDNVLAARLYKSEIVREGMAVYHLTAVSAIGLLDKLPHMGGLYTGQTVSVVLADIIGNTFSYTVASDVASILVFGWLPAATRRDNLRQLLFATGVAVRKSADGTINFAFLSASSPSEIINDRIYSGGKVAYTAPATGVDVTEHAFYSTAADQTVTLFDNTDGSGAVVRKTVTFDRPCHNLSATGLTLHESGVNYAIISGTGTLTGKEYTHQTKIISRRLTTTTSENIKTVQDATLITMVNSGSVADRILAYYSGAKTLTAGIVAGTERPGDAVYMEDAFGDLTAGLMESMDIRISATLKADTTIATGYVPGNHGNEYNNSVVLTGSGYWTVPAGVTKIKRALIGGGDGGSGGHPGTDGSAGSATQYDPLDAWVTGSDSPGEGGDPGIKGQGGRIYADEITVTPGQIIQFACGVGGNGGAAESAGSAGTDTTFGGVSSASGTRSQYGFYDYYSGLAYGTDGPNGYAGADGGVGVSTAPAYPVDPESIRAFNGIPGNNCDDGTSGGTAGTALNGVVGGDYVVAACGGSGGGAAHGTAGGSGANGSYEQDDGSSSWITWYRAIGGAGGNGATPISGSSGAHYGCGGGAGHGGGGGGCPGGAFCGKIKGSNYDHAYASQGGVGIGASGSNGGDGAPGCVVIYY